MPKQKVATKRWGEFGQFVRARRRAVGVSLTTLARSMDFDQGVLSKIERGIRRAPQIVPYVQRIAACLGFEPSSDEYRELMDLAYKERFSGRPDPTGRSLIVTLGPASGCPASPGLGGLSPEFTAPGSPAGRYYESQGYKAGTALPPEIGPPPASTQIPLLMPSLGISIEAMFQLVDSMGLRVISFEEMEAGMKAEIRCPDGIEYEVRVK
jgi:transcriptional regulator with XRE-family HTH domain